MAYAPSSRILIIVMLGLTFILARPVTSSAADYGGCCADLEERVAELEATTVRKGNKKVSVTISGWLIKAVNWWDDGDLDEAHVGDWGEDLTSRFSIAGKATIAPGWATGYNITITVPGAFAGEIENGNVFGVFSNQFNEDSFILSGINTHLSYMFLESEKFGTLSWGYLSPASNNTTALVDKSGSVIQSNVVFLQGPGFFLRPAGAKGSAGLSDLTWGDFLFCAGFGAPGGGDCNISANGVRYDTPNWNGFSFATSAYDNVGSNTEVYDFAVTYDREWENFRFAAAYTFTHWTDVSGIAFVPSTNTDSDLHQVAGYIQHMQSGLFLFGYYMREDVGGFGTGPFTSFDKADVWFAKAGIRRNWTQFGATVLYGEYQAAKDQFGPVAGLDICGTPLGCFVTGSTVERWGLGAVQEIDTASMSLFVRWHEIRMDKLDLVDIAGSRVNRNFDDWSLFQAGAIIFF